MSSNLIPEYPSLSSFLCPGRGSNDLIEEVYHNRHSGHRFSSIDGFALLEGGRTRLRFVLTESPTEGLLRKAGYHLGEKKPPQAFLGYEASDPPEMAHVNAVPVHVLRDGQIRKLLLDMLAVHIL